MPDPAQPEAPLTLQRDSLPDLMHSVCFASSESIYAL